MVTGPAFSDSNACNQCFARSEGEGGHVEGVAPTATTSTIAIFLNGPTHPTLLPTPHPNIAFKHAFSIHTPFFPQKSMFYRVWVCLGCASNLEATNLEAGEEATNLETAHNPTQATRHDHAQPFSNVVSQFGQQSMHAIQRTLRVYAAPQARSQSSSLPVLTSLPSPHFSWQK